MHDFIIFIPKKGWKKCLPNRHSVASFQNAAKKKLSVPPPPACSWKWILDSQFQQSFFPKTELFHLYRPFHLLPLTISIGFGQHFLKLCYPVVPSPSTALVTDTSHAKTSAATTGARFNVSTVWPTPLFVYESAIHYPGPAHIFLVWNSWIWPLTSLEDCFFSLCRSLRQLAT